MNKIQKRYNRVARIYDLLEGPMETLFSKWRNDLLKNAKGKVLEAGIGTGKNIPYYPKGIKLTGIDFSNKMIEQARKKYGDQAQIELLEMDAEQMTFEDNSFDTVVTSCVFCSVPDPVSGLKEIRRVCKVGGKVLMLEHVRSNHKIIGLLMDLLNPIPLYIHGANINRKTEENLIKAGFVRDNIKVTNLWYDIVKLFEIDNRKEI